MTRSLYPPIKEKNTHGPSKRAFLFLFSGFENTVKMTTLVLKKWA